MPRKVTHDEVRKRLNRRMLELDLTYREVADQTGYTHQAVGRYLTGETQEVPGIFLARFSVATRTNVVWLLLGLGTPQVSPDLKAAEVFIGELEECLERYRRKIHKAETGSVSNGSSRGLGSPEEGAPS